MAFVCGVNIPDDKRISIALRFIHGIGRTTADKIIANCNIKGNPKVYDMTQVELDRIRELIDTKYIIEGDLRQQVDMNIRRLIEIGSYKGSRHKLNLPVRGQRTKTNARTKRGRKQTVNKKALATTYFTQYNKSKRWN